ncbi:transcriptional regulator NrdR [Candidatus Woesebacteria bacterium RIFCSPHIGHO2_02_FULL_38_9]|uniref:Transcriptional repressor NrdR n=1 Tax=Candidatus Woesebacteria bacterium RIFCSPHIGHO2_01_FULL_39_28 TaxID=1802496 RepID=A0A1F7Y8S6_9BACT|nr:MAG: transcriptional regulator NrdR [Candidatus Woesebacteria bacterium RIFCSPHIGHO2_01_FULL_39_28]OGM33744.1 MAG: transcriptional regulator NrdR [Candidatus Woesebacteria bacterium RIFCSPHIGHO2_02_FULL_38_9]OGM57261.1 MAG: transcriptional regulator NrdR [Candidatus Woesebacteria bacterium RIFCSPLOWO2_01_FULL_38_20]
MKCPFCAKSNTQVLESRIVEDGRSIRRRRECLRCHKRFTTFEKIKGTVLWVIKKDGKREPFDREKIKRGILRAIEKRPISLNLVDEVVEEVEREMLKRENEEISSRLIGKEVLKRLNKIDKVAWLRFASVYLEFEDLKDFEKVIDRK